MATNDLNPHRSGLRGEIQGLRAIAVVLVMLFHAGVTGFSAGYVGVDIFFVISGFIITVTMRRDLEKDQFRFWDFYARRARRILPALYVVMLACGVAGYFLLMPDDYKNLGQSIVASTVSANNFLLLKTAGYWDLASEFKPLLHTWSLGIEEQFYLVYPALLYACWRRTGYSVVMTLAFTAAASFFLAVSLRNEYPNSVFYLLPTRAWELLVGALFAIIESPLVEQVATLTRRRLASLGILLMALSLAMPAQPMQRYGSLVLLCATIGAAITICFARYSKAWHAVLAHPLMLSIGAISYSLYLWHQPLLAFARSWSPGPVGPLLLAGLMLVCFPIAYGTWRYVETPFRQPAVGSRPWVSGSVAVLMSLCLIGLGLYLNASYGVLARLGEGAGSATELDKRFYNLGAFKYKKTVYSEPQRPHVLIVGNSFGRDFVNMVTETFGDQWAEMVYRDDLPDCLRTIRDPADQRLLSQSDVVVFASNVLYGGCIRDNIRDAERVGKAIFYVGTKDFGANVNWLIRLPASERANQFNETSETILNLDAAMEQQVSPAHFIAVLTPILKDRHIPITDQRGRLLSSDRQHLTRFGAMYLGEKVLRGSSFEDAVNHRRDQLELDQPTSGSALRR